MNKWLTIGGLLFYWLVIPFAVYRFLTGPGMGYEKTVAGVFAGLLVLVPLAALPTLLKNKPNEGTVPPIEGGKLPPYVGWGIFAFFLLVLVGVLVFFAMREQ